MTKFVQFNADGSVTEYAGPQNAADKPGYAEIADDDARYLAWLARQAVPGTLAAKLASGLAVASSGTPAISATYALDQTTLDQIGSVARDAASGLGLPGGLTTFVYPDINSTPRTLTSANVQALYRAMRDIVSALNTQAAIALSGGTPSWPAQSATIA